MNSFKMNISLCALTLTAILSVFTACRQNETINNNTSTNLETSSNTQSLQTDKNQISVNPLTGLKIENNKVDYRPVAIMINNIYQAQPLIGISKADILYECLVEGGITRLEAVYKDISSVDSIGSIRSSRPPFITLAQGLDAVYVCCGTSTQAKELLSQNVVDHLDIQLHDDISFRDEWRRKNLGFEHSLLSNGELILEKMKKENIRLETNINYEQKFSSDSQVKNGKTAEKIKANFSGYKSTDFLYDHNKKTYLVYQYDKPMKDSAYNVQNTADNVIIIHVETNEIDDEGHIMLKLVGSGDGYYAANGKYIPIKWSKKSDSSPIKYTTSDGNDLTMTAGRQYICLIPTTQTALFE